MRDLYKYTGISNSAISNVENGNRPLLELQILKLTSFFDVTSDYLLGYANTGIGINFNDEHAYISATELERLRERYEIKETLLKVNPHDTEIRTPNEVRRVYRGEYIIFREVNVNKSDAHISASIKDNIITELNTLDDSDLEKVLKFIKEYIK